MTSGIANNWKELSGESNWKDRLDSPSPDLRSYIIHYGERVQAIYDAFNGDKDAENYGFPRCRPEDLFSEVGLEYGNPYKYTVTNYIYALSGIDYEGHLFYRHSAWIGYVAVATDEGKAALGRRDILISWRGTWLIEEWITDLEYLLTSASDILGNYYANDAQVHSGFHSIYTASGLEPYNKSSAREQVLKEVRKQVDNYKNEEISITITGHSLGSALATLNAADIVANGYNKPTGSNTGCMVTAFVFASPRVGNTGFKTVLQGLSDLHLLRVTIPRDIVTFLPPFTIYDDVGEKLSVDAESPYKRTDIDFQTKLSVNHNLENYLHEVAGPKANEFVVPRDYKLLNKGLDILLKDYKIPPQWWVVKNKNMIQSEEDGTWEVNPYKPDPPSA